MGNAVGAKGAVRPPGQSTGVYTTLPGQKSSQTLHSYNWLSTKSVLNNEKVNYIRSNPVTNSKEFRRQYPRHERRCACTVTEHRC